jgi:hypothetical protein
MQAMEIERESLGRTEPRQAIRVWIENEEGSITRGLLEALTDDGAFIRLTPPAAVAPGDAVAVRIAFDARTPTLAAAGRVLRLGPQGDGLACQLEWTHSGRERERLAAFVAALGLGRTNGTRIG